MWISWPLLLFQIDIGYSTSCFDTFSSKDLDLRNTKISWSNSSKSLILVKLRMMMKIVSIELCNSLQQVWFLDITFNDNITWAEFISKKTDRKNEKHYILQSLVSDSLTIIFIFVVVFHQDVKGVHERYYIVCALMPKLAIKIWISPKLYGWVR